MAITYPGLWSNTQTSTTGTAPAVGNRNTYTNVLLANIDTGKLITAADSTLLKDFINVMMNHTHSDTSLSQSNTDPDYVYPDGTNTTNDANAINFSTTTSVPDNSTDVTQAFAAASSITAAKHNALVTGHNAARSHNHTIVDRITMENHTSSKVYYGNQGATNNPYDSDKYWYTLDPNLGTGAATAPVYANGDYQTGYTQGPVGVNLGTGWTMTSGAVTLT